MLKKSESHVRIFCKIQCLDREKLGGYIMAGVNAEHINTFLMAATKILSDMCGCTPKVGKPTVKGTEFSDDTVVILIGVTGELRGQVLITFSEQIACDIAGKMCMMPIEQLDELSISAISELGNMIMGNAATVFSVNGVGIDITPPTVARGKMSLVTPVTNLSIPIQYEENKVIEFNLAIRQDQN